MRTKLGLSLCVALAALSANTSAQDAEPLAAPEGETPAAEASSSEVIAEAPAADAPPATDAPLETIPVAEADAAPPVEEDPESGRSRLTDEIVVTAQKREENILDVPISIAAFSGEALDAKGIGDAKTLAQSIPGVTYGETVNFSIIYVRGVGTDAFLPDSDLSVARLIVLKC
jgi:iron complex outermembrane recepter protein